MNDPQKKIKVAILGSAFDPVTKAHVAAVRYVLDNVSELDEAWLMPCFDHRYGKDMAAPDHRLAMCRLAAKCDPRIRVSAYEIDNQMGRETHRLVRKFLEDTSVRDKYDISFVIGLDNALSFEKWANHKYLEQNVRFVVVPRPGVRYDGGDQWFTKPPHAYLPGFGLKDPVSSTMARQAISGGDAKKAGEILAPEVLGYIWAKKLYAK